MGKSGIVIDAMIKYYLGYPRRINHFLKVYGFAKAIGDHSLTGGWRLL